MNKVIGNLLSGLSICPVLLDVGASGNPPKIWKDIAKYSVYVGFDPDLREMYESNSNGFYKSVIVNKAITNEVNKNEVVFYLTKSPFCSSTLKPDLQSLDDYLFSDLFQVERAVSVEATTLNDVIKQLSLEGINWFKTDSQGTDLRIFNSLSDEIRSQVLAVDIEPGLINAYMGEDLFIDAHRNLMNQGFWLSDLNVCGTVRLRRKTISTIHNIEPQIDIERMTQYVKNSPGWCESRYLRTIDWLRQSNASKKEYVLLWIFAVIDRQYAFAIDVAIDYEQTFGADTFSKMMINEPISILKKLSYRQKNLKNTVSNLLPKGVKKILKRFL